MNASAEIESRISKLTTRLKLGIAHHDRRARGNYWSAFLLMIVAILASLTAGLGGLFFGLTSQLTGLIALIPGAAAFVASTLKLEGKSNWHYRKRDALEALLHRLQFELPENPAADNVAAISSELSRTNSKFQEKWQQEFRLSWTTYKPR